MRGRTLEWIYLAKARSKNSKIRRDASFPIQDGGIRARYFFITERVIGNELSSINWELENMDLSTKNINLDLAKSDLENTLTKKKDRIGQFSGNGRHRNISPILRRRNTLTFIRENTSHLVMINSGSSRVFLMHRWSLLIVICEKMSLLYLT